MASNSVKIWRFYAWFIRWHKRKHKHNDKNETKILFLRLCIKPMAHMWTLCIYVWVGAKAYISLVWRRSYRFRLRTFSDIPWYTAEKNFRRICWILVMPRWQLATPRIRHFVTWSWEGKTCLRKEHIAKPLKNVIHVLLAKRSNVTNQQQLVATRLDEHLVGQGLCRDLSSEWNPIAYPWVSLS